MKHFYLLFFLVFSFCLKSFSQWQWSHHIGGIGNDRGGICVDRNNNNYVFGTFQFQGFFNTDTLISNGWNDFYLVKYDESGNEIWVKSFGGNNSTGFDELDGCREIDPAGNYIYISGSFRGTMLIDTHSVVSNGGTDLFLAKLDLNGNCIWLRSAGSMFDDKSGIFQFDPNGNILFTGRIYGTALFDSYSVDKGTFLSKYDSDGNCLWASKKFDGAYFIGIEYLGDDIIMTGTTTNDTAIIDTITLISNNVTDALIARFDSSGNVKWVKRNGGENSDYGVSIGLDNSGFIYNSGYFEDSANFNGTTLTNGNRSDFYFAKFNSSDGGLIWIKQSNAYGGSNAGAYGYMISVDSIGNTYLIGGFGGTATFGSTVLSTINDRDMFIARYDSAGNCFGAENFGPANGWNVRACSDGSILISGDFNNSFTLETNTLTSYGQQDMYIAKRNALIKVDEVERQSNDELLIYANPSSGKFKIKIPESIADLTGSILRIFDASGKKISEQVFKSNHDKMYLNAVIENAGVYTVQLISKEKVYTGNAIVN